jgi:putative addiction module component (TIGR02574 family)
MTKQEILTSVRQLPRAEQVDLAMTLWGMVEIRDDELPLTDIQRAALDERLAEAKANPQPAEDIDALSERLLRGEF